MVSHCPGRLRVRLFCARLQLVGGHRAVAPDPAHLLQQLLHGLLRLVRLHRGVAEEGPGPAGVPEEGPRPVGPVLVLAQVHVDARDELPAEDGVHHLLRDLLRVGPRRRGVPAQDRGLERPGAVVDVDDVLGPGLDRGHVLLRDAAARPAREGRLELRPDLGEGRVADHDERRVAGLEPGGVPAHDVVAGELLDRGAVARAGQGQRVGVAGPVDEARQHPQRHPERLRPLLLDRGELLLLQPVELGLREGRVQHHVREEGERGVEVRLERGERDRGRVEVGPGAELRAQPLQLVADLEGGARLRALVHHVAGEARGARRRELVRGVAGVDQQAHPDDRHLVALGHDELRGRSAASPAGRRAGAPRAPPRARAGSCGRRRPLPPRARGRGGPRARRRRPRASASPPPTPRPCPPPSPARAACGRSRAGRPTPGSAPGRRTCRRSRRCARRRARSRRGAPSSPAPPPRRWGRRGGGVPSPRRAPSPPRRGRRRAARWPGPRSVLPISDGALVGARRPSRSGRRRRAA